MKRSLFILSLMSLLFGSGCNSNKPINNQEKMKILFLHHSTGNGVWKGNPNKYIYKLTKKGDVEKLVSSYNKKNKTNYTIKEQAFPKSSPYGWNNYPYDYYNIWVKNAGQESYLEERTLEMLTKEYDVIVFKHCFPVSSIKQDADSADVNSEEKTLANYKLQYEALKHKIHEFPDTKFVVWTGAALVEAHTNEDEAKRAKEFVSWVKSEWGTDKDNIFIWDFNEIETEGGLYLKCEFAISSTNSHPNKDFNAKASKLFVRRLIDVIENDGKKTTLIGEPKS